MKNSKLPSMLFASLMMCNVLFGLVLVSSKTNTVSYDDFKSEIQLFDSYTVNKKQSSVTETPPPTSVDTPTSNENIGADDDKVVQYIYNQDGTLNEYEVEPSDDSEDDFDELSPEVKKAISDAEKIFDQEYGSGYTGIVNINMASLEMLQSLPGVGEETALNIIEHRLLIGGFTSIEQIKDVKNIGEKKFEKFKDRLKIID